MIRSVEPHDFRGSHCGFLTQASLVVVFLSWARLLDHHRLEYGNGLEASRCVSIAFHIAAFRAVSLWLKVLMLLMGAGWGRFLKFDLSVSMNLGQFILQKLSLGGWLAFGVWMSKLVTFG